MRRSISRADAEQVSSRASHDKTGAFAGALFAGLALTVLAGAVPASAQWIGSPGGGAVESTPIPASPAPANTSPEAAPSAQEPGGMMAPQQGGFSQGGMSGGMGMGGGMGMPQQPSPEVMATMKECQTQVTTLREDLESRVAVLQSAGKKKVGPSELCPLFRNYVSAQQKFVGYLTTNKTKCQVPDEALTNLKKGATQSTSMRDKICKAAQMQESGGGAGGGGPPPQGAVSAGLGLPSGLPSANLHSRPGGVFDTLGGSALR